jgi:hypothetical protein
LCGGCWSYPGLVIAIAIASGRFQHGRRGGSFESGQLFFDGLKNIFSEL